MKTNNPQSDFSKKEIRLPDGRRLIYYDFTSTPLKARERKEP